MIVDYIKAIAIDAREWCEGKNWWWRSILLAFLIWNTLAVLINPLERAGLFGAITLAFHEMGHIIWAFLGEWMAAAGGSITQLVVPVLASIMLLRQRDYFGASLMGLWLAASLSNLSVYIGDARARILPLVSLGGGEPKHDWAYLLGRIGLMEQDVFLAGLVRVSGFLVAVVSLWVSGWILWKMLRSPKTPGNIRYT